ncbi:hypothetical protein KKE28_00210, partial [Patescibacteria group bacterium]|nr:hypothetical protein [Patescibacteria group bacterium]
TKSVISSCADEFGAFLERIAEQHRLEWRERMAIHEAGHATLAWRSPSIKRIVITEIREYDGRVMARDTSFPTNISNWYMLSMALAGIAAELQVVGKSQMLTAKYDLQRAHKLATDLVAQGQDATSPPWGTEPDIEGMEDISRAFRIEPPDQEKRVLACGYKHAKTVLAENRSGLLNLAGTLYRQGRLDHAEVIAILGPRPFDERLLF